MFGPKKSDHKETLASAHAVFETNLGQFTIELFVNECPETCWNFINLATGTQETSRKGPFFDGLVFHRIIEGFMIQGGCPDGTGRGSPGYRFADEFRPNLKHDGPGVLSMANAGPGTNGSQFFITLAPTPHLNGRHTVFGKVTEGMDVISKIGTAPTNSQDRPLQDIVIQKVTIHKV